MALFAPAPLFPAKATIVQPGTRKRIEASSSVPANKKGETTSEAAEKSKKTKKATKKG
jgi:hypothetical protein